MKKIIFLLLLIPFLGNSQTTVQLASWAFTSNENAVAGQSYANPENASFSQTGNVAYSNAGVLMSNWGDGFYRDYRYMQVALAPTAGNYLYVQTLNFSQTKIGANGPSNYKIKYFVATNGESFNDATAPTPINDEVIASNPNKSITINKYVGPNQKLIVRFYAKNPSGQYNSDGWRINANTLKINGYKVGPLNGTYYINSGTIPNFTTITEGLNVINSVGVSGPVVFALDSNTYSTATGESFPLTINRITGNSTNNTFTIRPNNRTVVIESNANSVFTLNAAKNVIIDGYGSLTLYDNRTANDIRGVITLASTGTNRENDGANDNIFRNLTLRQTFHADGQIATGLYSSGVSSRITVDNVKLQDVSKGIYIDGNNASGNLSKTYTINNISFVNSSTNRPNLGIFLKNVEDYTISNSTISDITKITTGYLGTHSGIMIQGESSGQIFNNYIKNITNNVNNNIASGIYLDSGNNTVYNNVVSNISANNVNNNDDWNYDIKAQGIYIHSGANNKLYHNTVVMNATTNGGRSAALFIDGGTAVTVMNNLFVNQQTNFQQYGINCRIAKNQLTINNNNYYSSTNVGYLGGNITSIAAWRTATGQDANSVANKPVFDAATEFNLKANSTPNETFVGSNTLIASIPRDIKSVSRTAPTMGAYEYQHCAIEGDQVTFGNGKWFGYIYSNYTNSTVTPAVGNVNYKGYVIENASNFDRNVGEGAITGDENHICYPPYERFFVRYKMKLTNVPAGSYNITVGGDDGYRLYMNGTLVAGINNWGEHNYATTSKTVTLSGNIEFVLEYFDGPGTARVSFSYGKIQGDPTVFGDNVWNVYGFNSTNVDFNNNFANEPYSGYYVQGTLGVNTQDTANNGYSKNAAPSTSEGWMGAPMAAGTYTITHKRKGFPCGTYKLVMDNWDDDAEVYLDENPVAIWSKSGYSGGYNAAAREVGTYKLGPDSKLEVRLRQTGGDGNLKLSMTDIPVTYTNGAWSSDPVNSAIKVESNLVLADDLTVCSCTVKAGKKLTINANATLNVLTNVVVENTGNILVKNTGSLVQMRDDATFTGESNSFTMERNTTPMINYDFSYWGSPVAAQNLKTFSPNTLADKYYSFNGASWVIENPVTTSMTAGRGYIVRAPQGWANTITNGGVSSYNTTQPNGTFEGGVFQGVFTGKANAGTITVPLMGNVGVNNLIGNPYASPISVDEFIKGNSGKIDGTFYFWTHKTRVSQTPNQNGTYPYNNQDYAVYNKTGGVATSPIEKKPDGIIASGQGFFVRTIATGNVVFKNSMRVSGINKNKDFYRTGETTVENNRFWLSMGNVDGLYSEFLVGYNDDATNDFDVDFDGITTSTGNVMLYTTVNANKLAIQGRQAPFAQSDVVPVGYKAAAAGQYTISINKKEGLFENGQAIYIYDYVTNEHHDLTAGDFTFTSAAGTFDTRFEVRFADRTLGVETPVASNSDVIVYKNGNQIAAKATNFTIEDMQVYDITGKILFSKKGINSNEFSTASLNVANQVVVVKVTLDGGQTISRKVIMN